VYRRRRAVLGLSLLGFALSIVAIATGGVPRNANSFDFESGRAFSLMGDQLPKSGVGATFILQDNRYPASDPRFRQEVAVALARLGSDGRVAGIETPYTAPAARAAQMISTDKRMVLAVVALRGDFNAARTQFGEIRAAVTPPAGMTAVAAGDVALAYDFDSLLAADLQKAEIGSALVALVLLLVVFGTGVGALVCLAIGLLSVTGGVAAALLLAHVTDVSTYALNIVTLIGLGIAIDYSLFIVSRFREELANGRPVPDAIAVSMQTAGRAIAFSGITVAIGLAGMLFYRGTFLVSMGFCGAIVVAISVLMAVTFLPAVLAMLGPRINRLSVPVLRPKPFGQGLWHRIAVAVMRRPVAVLLPTVAVLLLAGSPFLHLHLANTDVTQLPPDAESRRGAELLASAFPGGGTNVIDVVVHFDHGTPLTAENLAVAEALSGRLHHTSGVAAVRSYVDVDPSLSATAYAQMYAMPASSLPAPVRDELVHGVGRDIALLEVVTPALPASDAAHELVRTIRAEVGIGGGSVLVTGDTAFDIDFVGYILQQTPLAVGFVMVTTFLVLLLLLRSLVLPIKAVVMNLLSLTAAFGAMVWIFQDGHLSGLLNITPSPIDPTLPVLLFCLVFGLSMDYEVFLLTRMQEAWRRTGDNRAAVAEGLERSGRLITGAAAIMITVFIAFGLARVVTIKATGIGMAVAVLADATLVRALVVPALMRLLGTANWWAPQWVRRLPGGSGAAARGAVADGAVPPGG
jgi:RND superfamily putative drug exporter